VAAGELQGDSVEVKVKGTKYIVVLKFKRILVPRAAQKNGMLLYTEEKRV
jgi:hypothetical protein